MVKGWFKKTVLTILIAALFVCGGGTSYFYWFIWKDLPDISEIDTYRPSLTTKLYSADGTKFAEFAVEKRTLVGYEDIPEHLRKAVVAVEDARFYNHNGLDWQGITRAFWENVRARKFVQGASTITQQLARALFLHPKKTLTRKAQEAILALRIDERYSKEEILTLYLNQVYLGRGAYGVEAAARTYFGKPVRELALGECALIAGLPRAPSFYNPYRRPETVEKRRQHVLKRMFDEHFISEEAYREALEHPPELRELETKSSPAPYFTEHIRRLLEDKYGSSRLYRDGLQVYTTLDLDLQQAAQKAVRWGVEELDKRQGWRPIMKVESLPREYSDLKEGEPLEEGRRVLGTVSEVQSEALLVKVLDKNGYVGAKDFKWAKIKNLGEKFFVGDKVLLKVKSPPGEEDGLYRFSLAQYPLVQGALVALDPYTGHIKSMVGGYDYRKSQFNRAVQAKRQPGSAFKPIIYAAGILEGYTPASILLDSPIIYKEKGAYKEWKPVNYHERFVGPTTLRDALEHSRNVVTIKMLQEIGVAKAVNMARAMGITSELDEDLSLALGSSSLSLLEITSAYGVFVSGGRRAAPICIRHIKDWDGNLLEENRPAPEKVLDEGVSYIMARLLQGVVENGTGWRAKRLGRSLAGKTGTTNNYIDAWFIGFSPQLVAGVWTGFDEPRTMGRLETGSRAASPIWVRFMEYAHRGLPAEDFAAPSGVVEVSIDAKSGMRATAECEHVIKEVFLADKTPQEKCDKHRPQAQKFLQVDLADNLDLLSEGEAERKASEGDGFVFD